MAVAIAANGTFPFSESVLREEIEKVRMESQSPGKLVGGVTWVRTVLAETGKDEFWKREGVKDDINEATQGIFLEGV